MQQLGGDLDRLAPLFGDPDDFYGNTFVEDPNDPDNAAAIEQASIVIARDSEGAETAIL